MDDSSYDSPKAPRNRFLSPGPTRTPSTGRTVKAAHVYVRPDAPPLSNKKKKAYLYSAQRNVSLRAPSPILEEDPASQDESDDENDSFASADHSEPKKIPSPAKKTPLVTNLANRLPSLASSTASSAPSSAPKSAMSKSPFATPRPLGAQSDIERRKSHLLATLQLTAGRSEARARFKRGTPHVAAAKSRRGSSADISSSEDASALGYSSAGGQNQVSDATSNDLNPFPTNNSLPLGDAKATRFNGAKLNAYLHTLNSQLTTENQNLINQLEERDNEIESLRQMAGIAGAPEDTDVNKSRGDMSAMLSSQMHHEVDRLQTVLDEREQEVETLRQQLLAAQEQRAEDRSDETKAQDQALEMVELQKQVFALQDALSSKQRETEEALEAAKEEREAQEEGFADKMKRLEDELCTVMEEQETQFEAAQAEARRLRAQVEEHQEELETLQEERARLQAQLEAETTGTTRSQTQDDQSHSEAQALHDEISQLQKQLRATQSASEEADSAVERLEKLKAQAESQLQDVEQELAESKGIVATLQARLEEATSGKPSAGSELHRQLEEAKQEIARLKAAAQDEWAAQGGTPEKSLPFRSILGVPTPKTPGFYKLNTTYRTANGSDESMSPLMVQIESLERQVRQLQTQLKATNRELDEKIRKLQLADSEHLSTNKRLAAANARIAQLESKHGGSAAAQEDYEELAKNVERVRGDALALGRDIAAARRGQAPSLSSEEAKTLLALVGFLKAQITRESRLRFDVVVQKKYLMGLYEAQQSRSNTLSRTLQKYGLPAGTLSARQATRPTLKAAALAVLAVCRMQLSSERWAEHLATKTAIREAYAVTRGRPYPL